MLQPLQHGGAIGIALQTCSEGADVQNLHTFLKLMQPCLNREHPKAGFEQNGEPPSLRLSAQRRTKRERSGAQRESAAAHMRDCTMVRDAPTGRTRGLDREKKREIQDDVIPQLRSQPSREVLPCAV